MMFNVILGILKINPVNGLAFVFILRCWVHLTNSEIINLQKVRLSLSY